MSYMEQFDIEMQLNYNINQNYRMISYILSDDAFSRYKQILWVFGFVINYFVLMNFEVINGELVIFSSEKKNMLEKASWAMLIAASTILTFWFTFRYKAIRRIETEKMYIKEPDFNPNNLLNNLILSVGPSL